MFPGLKRRVKSLLSPRLQGFAELIIEKKFDELWEIRKQIKGYAVAPDKDKASYWENKFDAQEFILRFENMGVSVEKIEIDIQDFESWMKMYPTLVGFYSKSGDVRIEKLLEHYLSWKYLNITAADVVIDVAAAGSPFAKVLRQKKIEAYRQDLSYPAGIYEYEIGGDAGNMPVPDKFADVLTLHCAFECFQGDADLRFARDVSRILRKGGRVGIVPLYIDAIPFVKTSPWCDKRTIQVEPEAHWLWRDDRYKAPFSRHYSPESFVERIVSVMSNISTRVLFFSNLWQLSAHYDQQRIYCHFMFKGEKL